MKKAFIFIFLVLGAINTYAGTELKDACRQILYAVKPVEEIAKVNDSRLRTLARFSLGIGVEGEDPLSETDAMLFSFLSRVEMRRRQAAKNEFSLFLQDEREKLKPYIQGSGDVTAYIKMDGWIDLFQLNLMF